MTVFTFFENHPERMILAALGFLTLYIIGCVVFFLKGKKIRRLWPMLILVCVWFCWAVWESHCQNMGYNIRVDLLLLAPLILALSIGLTGYQITLLLPKEETASK